SIEERVATAIPALRSSIPRIPLGRAVAIAEPLLERLRSTPGVAWAAPVGSLRRGQDTVGDVELVAAASDPAAAIESAREGRDIGRCLHGSQRRLYVRTDRVQIGIRLPDPAVAAAELLFLTGSPRHVQALEDLAGQKDLRLTPSGLLTANGAFLP